MAPMLTWCRPRRDASRGGGFACANPLAARPADLYHRISNNSHGNEMKFDELVRLKALQLKADNTGQTIMEMVGESQLALPEVQQELKLRQVCAMVSPAIFEKLEGLCSMLGVSKRQFITGALVDAMDRAEGIVADVDPFQGGN